MENPELSHLSEHVYLFPPDPRTDRPTLGVIVGTQATLLVDAGNSPTHARLLLDELDRLHIAAPKFIVLTHYHWDHWFGASAYNATIYAQEQTTQAIQHMAQLDWSDEALDRRVAEGTEIAFCRDMIQAEYPDRSQLQLKVPDVSFKTQHEFDLGEISCQVKHVGGDHSPDSSIVYVPEDRILFLGDCISEDLHHGAPRYTISKLYPLLAEIMSYDVDYYVLGHDPEPLPRNEMMDYFGLLKLIGNLVTRTENERGLVLQNLREELGRDLTPDHVSLADAFLAGISQS